MCTVLLAPDNGKWPFISIDFMRTKSTFRSVVSTVCVAIVGEFLALLAGPVSAQELFPPPILESLTVPSPVAEKTFTGSIVFPEGTFPTFPVSQSKQIETVDQNQSVELQEESGSPYSGYDLDEVQNAPAIEYWPPSNVLPSYYYDPSYYEAYGVGARAIADYAPPGYEAREYETAPGEPEFTQIIPPTRPVPGAPSNLVTRGMFPGSFLVPGTNTSFRLRGFVRLASLYDLDPIGSTDSFVTNTIPVPQQSGQNYNMSARMSRFAIESWTPTNFKTWNVHTFIEGDFFNGPAQAAGGGGNPFRLRHAFVDFGYFRFGQQNSVFMDGNNWPSLVDFQGPNSWVNQRQPSARMTIPIFDRLYMASSIERPFSDITTNGLGNGVQDVPDMATHLRYEGDVGHIQISTIMRTIGYRPTGGEVTRRTGGGASGSVVFHPWAIVLDTDPVHEANPSGLTRSRILMQGTWGPGVGRYLNDLAGQGFDGQVDPITGEFDLVESKGWNASYEHWFNGQWLSNFTYSEVHPDSVAGQLGTTYDKATYLAASLWWIPIPRMSLGIEFITGRRENLDGQHARADRLGGLFQYNF